jgi:uncharacterized protein YqgV (UPF0045/DUF77 family)
MNPVLNGFSILHNGRATMLAEFSIMPLGKSEHLGSHVAEVLKIVDESGLDYRLHAR